MKNREKYPNIDDALKTFKEHKKEHNCDCTFETWLDVDEDKINALLGASTFGPVGFAAAFLAFARAKLKAEKTTSADVEETIKHITNVECPFCHQKNGRIAADLYPDFYCPDCDLLIAKRQFVRMSSNVDVGTFKSWFDKLTVPAPKKD